jgi:hypothetical protein
MIMKYKVGDIVKVKEDLKLVRILEDCVYVNQWLSLQVS